jgi:agmatine/peptidylarginine deiminase
MNSQSSIFFTRMRKFILALTTAFGLGMYTHAQITTAPNFSSIRAMAEWEEVQALTISWTSFPAILKQIVAAARLETQVVIISDNIQETEDYLLSSNTGGPAFPNLENVLIVDGNYDSIWLRDYAANPVYGNEVDSLILVDWLYNRNRPNDDTSPAYIADALNLDLYETSASPFDLVNTGGNYMSDGFGTAFASELVLEENDGNGDYNIYYPTHNEEQIDNILETFMGIHTYIKMPTLPYDGIHHIDMHMKLVDEETLLVSEYPQGVADGPQINANINYVLSNYSSKFGTPFRVVRIPAPPSTGGNYPDNNGAYRTYTNAVFVNNTIIIPTYREEYDTTALRIWGEVCPGYTLVGIDCDNTNNNIIAQSGAIHCITHTVGVSDPLLISHQPLSDTEDDVNPYLVSAYLSHRSGIDRATLYWRLQGSTAFSVVTMISNGDNWEGFIPAQAVGSIIEYYVEGESVSGKIQVRPMPAPQGFWSFEILGAPNGVTDFNASTINRIYPNPASAITCIEVANTQTVNARITLVDMTGRTIHTIHEGIVRGGSSNFFLHADQFESGVYQVTIQTPQSLSSMPILIH